MNSFAESGICGVNYLQQKKGGSIFNIQKVFSGQNWSFMAYSVMIKVQYYRQKIRKKQYVLAGPSIAVTPNFNLLKKQEYFSNCRKNVETGNIGISRCGGPEPSKTVGPHCSLWSQRIDLRALFRSCLYIRPSLFLFLFWSRKTLLIFINTKIMKNCYHF